jgi:predicted enzyme related to lactoylglutathione lyase
VHPGAIPDPDPSANPAAVYFFVADADALHAEWRVANGGGQLIEPTDTDYGMREGAHIDDDGNRIRFGAPLHH